jgi:hypothetical protein
MSNCYLVVERNPAVSLVSFSSASYVAPLPTKNKRLPSCCPLSIPLLGYWSPINNLHLSYVTSKSAVTWISVAILIFIYSVHCWRVGNVQSSLHRLPLVLMKNYNLTTGCVICINFLILEWIGMKLTAYHTHVTTVYKKMSVCDIASVTASLSEINRMNVTGHFFQIVLPPLFLNTAQTYHYQ